MLNYALTRFLPRLAIFIPHTAEEAYKHWNGQNRSESLLLADCPETVTLVDESEILSLSVRFKSLKDAVNAVVEGLRRDKTINKSNEAAVMLPQSLAGEKFAPELKRWLNVAEVSFGAVDAPIATKSTHPRCPRCWTHFAPGELNDQGLCARCAKVMQAF